MLLRRLILPYLAVGLLWSSAGMRLGAQETRGIGGVFGRAQRSADRWAVIIGISKYRNLGRERQLRYAAADAQALHAFLRTPQGGAFAPDHVRLLLDEQATLLAMKSALGNFLLSAGRDDVVIVFFAGHGQVEPGRTETVYLLPHDADLKDLFSTAYAVQELRSALSRRVYAQRVVMVIDACHSGSLGHADVLTRSASDVFSRYLTAIGSAENGRAVLTASSPTELSQEGERWGGGHGVFTYHLLEALKGRADARLGGQSDGIVSLHEAFEYTLRNVARDTKNAQHPGLSGAFSIPLAVCDVDRARQTIEQPQRVRPERQLGVEGSPAPPQNVRPGQPFSLEVQIAASGTLLAKLDRARQAMRRNLKATLTASGFALNAEQLEQIYRKGKEVDFENGDAAVKLKMAFTAPK